MRESGLEPRSVSKSSCSFHKITEYPWNVAAGNIFLFPVLQMLVWPERPVELKRIRNF